MIKKIIAFFIVLIVIVSIALFVFLFYFYKSVTFNAEKIINYNPPQSALFYDRDGRLLAVKYAKQNRIYVKYKNIPGRVIEALLATEDTSFFENPGISINAIIRALITDIKDHRKAEGASTITQQLVRNIYLNRRKTIKRKLTEIAIALKIDHILTKQQILERYLNQIYFGNGYYGIRTAALGYFHKDLKDLTLKEIAMLIALPKGPSLYDPAVHYDLNIRRADWILKRLYYLGWITPKEYKKALLQRPKVYKHMISDKAPYAVNTAIQRLLPKYPDLLTKGYKVYLTIDLPIQKLARKTLKWNYKRILRINPKLNPKELNGAMITINQHTGGVLAIVGGVNYKESQFNRATQSRRGLGSSIKPFVYQIALNEGYNPGSLIPDTALKFKIPADDDSYKYWKVRNYEDRTLGLITLRNALVYSQNLATVHLALELGLNNIIAHLQKFGFKHIPRNLSIVLGSIGVSMWKMSELYTIFSNYGVKTQVHIVKKLVIPKENITIIPKYKKVKIEPASQAYLIINILQDVVKRGTGQFARVKGIQIAGKTGTTNKWRDAWFDGFTPSTETLIWFGNDNYTSLGRQMPGGIVSAPAFRYFYEHLIQIYPGLKRTFKIPKGVHTYIMPNGKKEIFTRMSLPPNRTITKEAPVF